MSSSSFCRVLPSAFRLVPFRSALCLLSFAFPLLSPTSAFADILTFTTGRLMSVASARIDGDRLLVTLHGGGEATISRALIARIDPDEVPDSPAPAGETIDGESAVDEVPSLAAMPASLEGRPFADVIAMAAAAHGVDARLVHAVIETESNYRPRARSHKGARGLMQLMPATARQYAAGDLYDPRTNVDAGVRHLKDLLSRFELRLALAAYNAGEATVRRYGGMPPYAETRAYVARILGLIGR